MLGTGHSRHVSHKRWLRISPAPRGAAPISVGMAPTCGPSVLGIPVRNTVAPVPIAPLVAPVVPVPTASTAVTDQLDRWFRAKLNGGRIGHDGRRLCRCNQG